MPTDKRLQTTAAITALREGTLSVAGRLPWSSNFTFLVDVEFEGEMSQAIYKPLEGEQPLWDFPYGELYKREVAAFELSQTLGWPDIPPTIVREDAPFGVGSLQRFIPSDFEQHYFTLMEDAKHETTLKTIATFDVVANNADRKAGHCLAADTGEIYAIDNALCFNVEPKLRTVIWEFGDQSVDGNLLTDIAALHANLPTTVSDLLEDDEIDALNDRIAELLEEPVLPQIQSQRQYPWPLV